MTPYYNPISAIAQAQYESLMAIDTEGLYACLGPICCNSYDTETFTKVFFIQWLLNQYSYTGTLPVVDEPCCLNNIVCGDLAGATPATVGPAPTFADLTVTDDFVLGDAFTRAGVVQPIYRSGIGTLALGTATITAAWVTANTAIVVSYNTPSAAGQANISRGTITPGASFVVNGEGTNTFTWMAIQNA